MPIGSQFDDFRVEARYPDGSTRVVTPQATLRSKDRPGEGPASFQDGRLLGVRPGKSTVRAEFDGVASTKDLQAEVTGQTQIDELRIRPAAAELMPGETIMLEAIGSKAGKSLGSITRRDELVWRSSDPQIARVDGPVVAGLRPGQATVTAQFGPHVSPPATITVQESIQKPLSVQPAVVRLGVGQRCRLGTDLVVWQGNRDVSRQCAVRYEATDHALVAGASGVS
ncbi:MAG: Ig-like domain-containing protein [Thermoguttaceae bacterium]